jgi:Domain of unknown function (DUF4440)
MFHSRFAGGVYCLFFSFMIFAACTPGEQRADVPATSPKDSLYYEIAHMDSVLFNAFNARDTLLLKTLFTTDLEFYHDNGGLTNYQQNMQSFKELASRNNGLNRQLVTGTMEVYPVKDYGAMQIGKHRFCHIENGKDDCGTFTFAHVWQRKDGQWKISRVLSYGH